MVEIEEENYFFRLSKYQDWLIEYLQQNAFVIPAFRQKQVLEFLKDPINDLCISRPKSRLSWGIELPFDDQYVTYVWFDALINYISGVGYGTDRFKTYWPVDYHVIGKDILVPSHSVYWTAMLKAIGVEPPKALLVHGWWHVGGQKMSKSTGMKIDPLEFVETYSADALRFFLTREMSVGQDSDFTLELFLGRYNADLANNLGNLVSRLLNMAGRSFPDGLQPASIVEEPETTLQDFWKQTHEDVLQAYAEFQFHLAMEKTFSFITAFVMSTLSGNTTFGLTIFTVTPMMPAFFMACVWLTSTSFAGSPAFFMYPALTRSHLALPPLPTIFPATIISAPFAPAAIILSSVQCITRLK